MATAIDFQALMRQEMAKAIAEQRLKAAPLDEAAAAQAGGGGENGTGDGAGKRPVSWQGIADPAFAMDKRHKIPSLEGFRVGAERVKGIYYVPELVTEEEEARLMQRVAHPPPSAICCLPR